MLRLNHLLESVSQQFQMPAFDTETTQIKAQLGGLDRRFVSVDSEITQIQRQIDQLDEQVEEISRILISIAIHPLIP